MTDYQMSAKHSVMLFLGELKESVESLDQISKLIHLDLIKKRAADLGVPFIISGIDLTHISMTYFLIHEY